MSEQAPAEIKREEAREELAKTPSYGEDPYREATE